MGKLPLSDAEDPLVCAAGSRGGGIPALIPEENAEIGQQLYVSPKA